MDEIIYTKGYETLREELKAELSKSVESFVRIGYLLKVARDTNILAESQYSNMEEFAYAEFKIDKGTASKFMAINDRFSEGGHSDHLKPEYNGIGWSKLSIMLQLPDTVNEEITTGFSKSEIQSIRDEIAEELKSTPLEHMLEGETETTAGMEDMLEKAVRQLGESEPELYVAMHAAARAGYSMDEVKATMAPSGENIYSIRIRGIGRIMLSLKDYEETIAMINERTGEKETRTWKELILAWSRCTYIGQTAEESWSLTYGQQYPKVAPVQPQEPKKEPKKVVKVNPEKPKPEAYAEQQNLHDIEESIPEPEERPAETEESENKTEASKTEQTEPEEQVPGQTSIEDMLEALSEEPTETAETLEGEQITSQGHEASKNMYRNGAYGNIGSAETNLENGMWQLARADLKNAISCIDKLIELEKMEIVES